MRDDALFDIEYGYWFNQANERLYHHIDVVLNMVQLLGGSAAALAVMQELPKGVVGAGLALALCSAVSLLVQPSVKSEQHRACKAQWRKLKARAAHINDADLHQAVSDLQGDGPTGISSLSTPAYNTTLSATGREDAVRALGTIQWIAASLA